MLGLLVNDKLERMIKEEVVIQLKVLSQHLPGGVEEGHRTWVRITGLRAEI
jgi:hypothetical protein